MEWFRNLSDDNWTTIVVSVVVAVIGGLFGLLWKVFEKRKLHQNSTGHPVVVICETEIPLASAKEPPPTLNIEVKWTRSFTLPVQIRNDSHELMTAISYVYLFTEDSPKVWPFCYNERRIHCHLAPMLAAPSDALDGLTKQFLLPITIPDLPPGVVERREINLAFMDDRKKCDATLRLRLHSGSQTYDYSFQLALEYIQDMPSPFLV